VDVSAALGRPLDAQYAAHGLEALLEALLAAFFAA
jgi:hypothetical protein